MYSHVTRKVDQDSWHHILDGFQDATVLQTITFSEVTLKRAEVEQFLVYKNSELVAAAQVRPRFKIFDRGKWYSTQYEGSNTIPFASRRPQRQFIEPVSHHLYRIHSLQI